VHEVIEAFRKAPSNRERGTRFEELMVKYFKLDPLLAQKYSDIWMWQDWPCRQGMDRIGFGGQAVESARVSRPEERIWDRHVVGSPMNTNSTQ
jgi:predicted helicase